MALNRFETQPVKRSEGHNAIGRAAYIGRDKMTDERSRKTWDYRHETGLEWRGLFVPKGAPEWAKDRQRLWNEAEAREDKSTRPDDARPARDFKIALPHELNAKQRIYLVTDFARELSRQGMIVDVAIHAPDEHGDERNYHVHMLATTREIGPDGFGKKVREWNKVETLQKWRARWSELGARQLERAGFRDEAERFREGHKTLIEQRKAALGRGDNEFATVLERAPMRHLGPQASAMERRGEKTYIGDRNREIIAVNNERVRAIKPGRQEKERVAKGRSVWDRSPARKALSAIEIVAKPAEMLGNLFEDLFAPKITPEQRLEAERTRREMEEAARLAKARESDRDR
jgi:MobA/MobL family